ncbi:MAG: type IV toxin-antitoxin system AbiEi family antitoxin, partial [Planctomycetota bacterium]|nr:type IV toxin-antitoxin system AbiEi family antitoxin [Planctomycetota bacterium]
MRQSEVVDRIRERLEGLLSDVPLLDAGQAITQMSLEDAHPDLLFKVMAGNQPWEIIVEAKSVGEPRQVRYAIQQLREYLVRTEDAYGVIAAPYISGDTARLCKGNGVGYIDLAGNCFLNFDQVYIEQKNYPNPTVEKRQLRSLFTPRSSRVLRVMLANPWRSWQVQKLAQEANVSLGLAFKIKERLLELEYAREEKRNILLNLPEELLDKWADNYSFRRNRMYDYFGFEEPKEIEQRLAGYCQEREIPYALTLFSGAALVAPFARYTRGFAYVSEGIPELADSLELKEVSSGPNFTILKPYDEGVLYGSRKIGGLEVTSDVQLYL